MRLRIICRRIRTYVSEPARPPNVCPAAMVAPSKEEIKTAPREMRADAEKS